MTFRILTYPKDQRLLRRVARPVTEEEFGSTALIEFGERLARTMMLARGMGLASTQVAEAPAGVPWAVVVLRLNDSASSVLCNPAIVSMGKMVKGPEGCLSFGSVMEHVTAPESVDLEFRTAVDGVIHTTSLRWIHARAAFHEVQHLSGRVISDRMQPLQRSMFLRRVEKATRGR